MKNRLVKPTAEASAQGYPNRTDGPSHHKGCDDGRRRFLRQLAGAGIVGLTGLPSLAHGQSIPVDFSRLEHHPSVRPEAQEMMAAEMAAPPEEEAPADTQEQVALPEAPAEPVAMVEENRALWVEPGYLIMLTWQRPDDPAVVAALEGSAQAVHDFLLGRVTQVDQLHNIEQLHVVEGELLVLLEGRVTPANITVLHMDHDCTRVCSTLDPGTSYPEFIPMPGEMPAPDWE